MYCHENWNKWLLEVSHKTIASAILWRNVSTLCPPGLSKRTRVAMTAPELLSLLGLDDSQCVGRNKISGITHAEGECN